MSGTKISSYCPEWENDERMAVMFAPLRNKQVNPESWNSKVQFWSSLVTKWCQHNKQGFVTREMLVKAFERNGKSPYCLSEVLTECWGSGQLVDMDRYRQSLQPRDTWGGWLVGVGRQAGQGLQDKVLGFTLSPEVKLVEEKVAGDLTSDLLEAIRKGVVGRSDVLRLKQSSFLSEKVMNEMVSLEEMVLLDFLLDSKQLSCRTVGGVVFYKVVEGEDLVSFDETDCGIIKLDQTQATLEGEIETGEEELKALQTKAKELLKTGSRMSAKSILRKKKMVEQNIESKLNQKMNIENILEQIRGAETNKLVVESYKSGFDALKESLADSSLDSVDELVDDISDMVGKAGDINSILSKNRIDDTSDTADLERELEELSDEETPVFKPKEDEEELLIDLEKLAVEDGLLPQIKKKGTIAGEPLATS